MENEIKFREFPVLSWLIGVASIGYGSFMLIQAPPALTNALLFIGFGGFLLLVNYGLTITASRETQTLRLDYRSLLLHSVKEIPLAEIATIRMDSRSTRSSSSGSRRRTTTYCIVLEKKNGEKVPFRSFYSSGFIRNQRTVDGLRKFLGLPETVDESPIGFIRAAPVVGRMVAEQQQAALTGANVQEQMTDGIHWQLQPIGMGASPATRWFSPDYKTQGGFLYLAQKVTGQNSAGGLMASFGNMLFKQALSMYGFGVDAIPNLERAETIPSLPARIEPYFTAFGNLKTETTQILNPWAQNPLAEWGERHPMKTIQSSGSMSQLSILFSPLGVYLVTLGALQPDQVDEITRLGVDLIRAQGIR